MENNPSHLEKLIEKVELYSKTSLDLFKHTAILRSADVFSNVTARLFVFLFVLLFMLFVNIALALWLGKELGESYYGFFAVAAIYFFLGIVFYVFRDALIKHPVSNYIIVKLQKEMI
jgi:apolipoprotein N-acyltransferase